LLPISLPLHLPMLCFLMFHCPYNECFSLNCIHTKKSSGAGFPSWNLWDILIH
jgi:hypothetical protein